MTQPEGPERLLVLVTGTGRSGTSTVSGTLHHLGLHVPGPYLDTNASNPKGFFESRWALEFHQELVRRADINEFDSEPDALERIVAAVTPELRERLVDWLREQRDVAAQTVVKDPRTVWAQALWAGAAEEAGLGIRFLSMLRHPAEVIGSRSTYYAKNADEERRRSYEIFSLCRWLNSALVSEHETRGHPRAFVHYFDLLENWRPAMERAGKQLGLTYDPPVERRPHPVDEFIDPALRRVRVTWDDLEIPGELQAVAEGTWQELVRLAAAGGDDVEASRRLDELRERYRLLFAQAVSISHDHTRQMSDRARRKGGRVARKRMRENRAPEDTPVADRPVRDVPVRDLVRVIGARAARRARRR